MSLVTPVWDDAPGVPGHQEVWVQALPLGVNPFYDVKSDDQITLYDITDCVMQMSWVIWNLVDIVSHGNYFRPDLAGMMAVAMELNL